MHISLYNDALPYDIFLGPLAELIECVVLLFVRGFRGGGGEEGVVNITDPDPLENYKSYQASIQNWTIIGPPAMAFR